MKYDTDSNLMNFASFNCTFKVLIQFFDRNALIYFVFLLVSATAFNLQKKCTLKSSWKRTRYDCSIFSVDVEFIIFFIASGRGTIFGYFVVKIHCTFPYMMWLVSLKKSKTDESDVNCYLNSILWLILTVVKLVVLISKSSNYELCSIYIVTKWHSYWPKVFLLV